MTIFQDIFDPGHKDRKHARQNAENAVRDWQAQRAAYQGVPEFDIGSMQQYETGPYEQAAQEKYLGDPWDRVAAGLQAESMAGRNAEGRKEDSAYKGLSSAYDKMGPSAYSDLKSAYNDLDPASMAAMKGGADYFDRLSSGESDPIAEAQYQQRVAEAEGARRANVDAALAAEEGRGADSGSNRMLAELRGAQDSTSDQYQAGLGANALAAARRDTAAGQRAQIGSAMSAADQARAAGLDANAATRAAGMDEYGQATAAGQDRFATTRAGGLDASEQARQQQLDNWANQRYAEYYGIGERNADRDQSTRDRNYDRAWITSDRNTDAYNNANWYNQTQVPQQDFENQMAMTSGQANARLGQASVNQANAANHINWGEKFFDAGANVATAAATPKPKT